MAKTKPIGVRFDEDLLQGLKEDKIATTPQSVLNFLTAYYIRNEKHVNGGPNLPELFRNINQDVQVKKVVKEKEQSKEVIVKEITPDKSDDLFERFKGVKIFRIDEFTNYPDKEKPVDKLEAAAWAMKKKAGDQKIRDQWAEFLKNNKRNEKI